MSCVYDLRQVKKKGLTRYNLFTVLFFTASQGLCSWMRRSDYLLCPICVDYEKSTN